MKTPETVTPSSQVDASLPTWIRTPDVVVNGNTMVSYSQEHHRNFVNFMTAAGESQERYGFTENLLQNLLKYKDFNTYRNPIVSYSILTIDGSTGSGTSQYNILDTSYSEHTLAARPQGQALNILIGKPLTDDDLLLGKDNTEQMEIQNGYGFPEENGVILIDEEVILYRRREGNILYDLRRGSSGVSILPTYREPGKYHHKTEPADHYAGSVVYNLSVLFLTSILDQIHKTYAHKIDSSRVVPEVNRDTLLKNIKDFFKAKGSKLGIKALFKILFNETDVDVFYPGDRMIKPSESTWVKSMVMRTVPLPEVFCDPYEKYTLPDKTIGSEVVFKSYSATVVNDKGEEVSYLEDDVFAKTYAEYCISYQYGDETQYEMYLNKEELEGTIIANPNTQLTRNLFMFGAGQSNDERRDTTTVTVESTLGFPERGVIFINNEAIFYRNKTPNQFLDCSRGYIGVNAYHEIGSHVYGPYYIETTITDADGDEYVSRSWPLGLVESVEVEDPGLLHTVDDPVLLAGPGRYDFREQILASIFVENSLVQPLQNNNVVPTFLENYNDDLVTQKSSDPDEIAYVGNRTHGVDSVFYDKKYVYISSSGFPDYEIGYFNSNLTIPVEEKVGPKLVSDQVIAIIPRREIIKENVFEKKGTDIIGIFVDGVRAYSNVSPLKIYQGRITSYNVDNPGYGYINPSVVVTPRAEAEVEVSPLTGEILSISVVNESPEPNFVDEPRVRITSGEGAEIRLLFDNYGRIFRADVLQKGRYYKDVPALKVVDPTGVGKGCVLSCTIKDGYIEEVAVVNKGIDYNKLETYVDVIPVGSGGLASANIEYYEINRYTEVDYSNKWQFDHGRGFLYEPPVGLDKKYYGYVASPDELRYKLQDSPLTHSKIMGWALDGNPIYGPYGYKNNVDDSEGFERQQSGYKLLPSRNTVIPGGGDKPGLNPPNLSDYPIGAFIQDFVYSPDDYMIDGIVSNPIEGLLANEDPELLETDTVVPQNIEIHTTFEPGIGKVYPNNLLDENNGKICNTPDFPKELYPDGVYCYFITLEDDNITPAFPYIIGKTFHNRPLSQNIDMQSHESVSALPRLSGEEYRPYQADGIVHTFDFKKAERLRNPYLEDTKDELKLEIGEVSEGGIKEVSIETGLPLTTTIGDRVFFDNTNTMGGGAQAVVSEIKGRLVTEARGETISTRLISHHQRLDLSGNIDGFFRPKRYTIVEDSKLTTFDYTFNSQLQCKNFNDTRNRLEVKTLSSTLPMPNQKGRDNKRRLFDVTGVISLPELEDESDLWLEDVTHFEVGEKLIIKNGSTHDGYKPHERVKILGISSLIDFIPDPDHLYDIVDGGSSSDSYPDSIDGGFSNSNLENVSDAGDWESGMYPPVNRKIEVARAVNDQSRFIMDRTEVISADKFFYTIFTDNLHYLDEGDEITIHNSIHPKLNGKHTIVKASETTFSIYTDRLYAIDPNVSYTSRSEKVQGEPLAIKIVSPGYGYSDLPKLLGLYKRFVDRGEFKIKMAGSGIGSVEVLNGGARYVNPKAVFIDFQNSGSGAEAVVDVFDGVVRSITVTDPGQGYIDPIIYLVESDGKYIATTDDIGKIKSVKVINPGRNISADRTLKPEIVIDAKCVVNYSEAYAEIVIDGGSSDFAPEDVIDGGIQARAEYPDFDIERLPDVDIAPFKEGEVLYQGTKHKHEVVGLVSDYDADRQILTITHIQGILKDGEKIYNNTGTVADVLLEGQSDCRCIINGTSVPEGRYIDDTSMVSRKYAVIQDSYRYQWFSYVISSPLQQTKYGEFVKELIHPAGFIQFADLTLHSSVDSKVKVDEEVVISKY